MNNYIGEKWIDFSMPYGVFYTGLDESDAKVYVQNNPTIWQDGEKTPVYIMGSTIGTHVGPGAIGVAYFEK